MGSVEMSGKGFWGSKGNTSQTGKQTLEIHQRTVCFSCIRL